MGRLGTGVPDTDLEGRAVAIPKLCDRRTDELGPVGQLCTGFLGTIDTKRSAAGEQQWRDCDRRNSEPQDMARTTHGATRTARIGT